MNLRTTTLLISLLCCTMAQGRMVKKGNSRYFTEPAVTSSQPVEWKAKWIGAPWEGEEFNDENPSIAPELRKKVQLNKRVSKAIVHVTGLGFFEFYVNGRKVSKDVLSPHETMYTFRGDAVRTSSIPYMDGDNRGYRVSYLDYDITHLLHRGGNEFSALLGNGFYAVKVKGMVTAYGSPRFLCQIELTYSDGSTETIISDESWEVRSSSIVHNSLYTGETFDARVGKGEWTSAVLRKAPDGKLVPQAAAPDRVKEVLRPQSITRLEDGSWDVDFGDYIAGWVRLRNFTLANGDSIKVSFISECTGNGPMVYIGDGSRVKSYAPRFTWFAFNRINVKGWPGELKARNITAEAVYTDLPVTSEFSCSNNLFNKINKIWRRSQTDNMHLGVATDCPHREKGPYTGDGEVACVTVMHNYGAREFYRKWLRDMSDSQDLNTGYVPNGAPWHPGCGGGVAWGAAMNIIPWEHYIHYGDISILSENYLQMTEQIRFMLNWRREDGTSLQTMPFGEKNTYWMNLGEWCPPYKTLVEDALVHTYFLWKCATYTANAARVLGKEQDYKTYSALAEDVAESFDKVWYNPETGSYGKGGADIFALSMGVPEEHRLTAIEAIKAEMKANGGHLYTGIFGTQLFFEVLADNGLNELAFEAMNNRTEPGFGWWIEQGAQTTWEEWDGSNSHNHPMFGGGLTWFYRKLAGLDALSPGYDIIQYKPMPVGDVTWARYKALTPHGKASIDWKIKNGRIRVKISVPKGSKGCVTLPDGSQYEVEAGKHRFKCKV